MDDRRRSGRVRTFLKGRIEFSGRTLSMDCLVRDFSEGGARLELDETQNLPDHFDLHVPHKARSFACTLSWRTRDEVGVAFGEAATASGTAALLRRIAELQAENAELRRRLTAEGLSERAA